MNHMNYFLEPPGWGLDIPRALNGSAGGSDIQASQIDISYLCNEWYDQGNRVGFKTCRLDRMGAIISPKTGKSIKYEIRKIRRFPSRNDPQIHANIEYIL